MPREGEIRSTISLIETDKIRIVLKSAWHFYLQLSIITIIRKLLLPVKVPLENGYFSTNFNFCKPDLKAVAEAEAGSGSGGRGKKI